MKYIILDLEWDGAFYPKIGRFINQILQIGAVKLNGKFEIEDTFERTVRSSFTGRVSKRFAELTGITKEMMLSGISLEQAILEYNTWVGDDTVTMTWSNSDIYTLIDNQKNITEQKLKIEKYLDLQKYVQDEMRIRGIEVSSQISLINAANLLNVDVDESVLHNAKYDSIACAAIFKECYNSERFSGRVINAADPDFLSRYTFKPHFITDINDPAIDRSAFDFTCDICGLPLKLKGEWRARNCAFYADMFCTNCKVKYFARVRIRKLYDSIKAHRKLYIKRKKENKNDM